MLYYIIINEYLIVQINILLTVDPNELLILV